MKYIVLFITTFVVVFVLYFITVISNKRKLSKFPKSNQALLLINRYQLNIDKNNVRGFAMKIALANSFIIAIVIVAIEFVNNIILKLLIAILIMLPLIIMCYSRIAKSMKKEGK